MTEWVASGDPLVYYVSSTDVTIYDDYIPSNAVLVVHLGGQRHNLVILSSYIIVWTTRTTSSHVSFCIRSRLFSIVGGFHYCVTLKCP